MPLNRRASGASPVERGHRGPKDGDLGNHRYDTAGATSFEQTAHDDVFAERDLIS